MIGGVHLGLLLQVDSVGHLSERRTRCPMKYIVSIEKRLRTDGRAESADEKRERIVAGDRELLVPPRCRRSRLDAVAKPAGAARSTVYLAFETRGGLFEAVAAGAARRRRLRSARRGIAVPDPCGPPRKLRRGCPAVRGRPAGGWRALWSWGELEPDAAGAIGVLEHGRWREWAPRPPAPQAGPPTGWGLSREAAEALWVLIELRCVRPALHRPPLPPEVARRLWRWPSGPFWTWPDIRPRPWFQG